MSKYSFIFVAVLVLAGCGSRTVNVSYQPPGNAMPGDWFPVPTETERTVTDGERTVERPPLVLADSKTINDSESPLSVTETTDSFGNVSLAVNRGASLTWELLDSSVTRLGWPVSDRNRSEYRLQLRDADVAASNGIFARMGRLFDDEHQPVHLILVPRIDQTTISAEFEDGTVLPQEDNQRLMAQLREQMRQGG
ncbi:hypothetical protein [Saccharospirillum mangrovi]|uniref:hypothetical protein n=1 Tax=Saccharospirillum mangrovi TaxID=2161747 RepID=UPI0013006938|nr:hypothetical protein [Saccharospirillum mangrovi]